MSKVAYELTAANGVKCRWRAQGDLAGEYLGFIARCAGLRPSNDFDAELELIDLPAAEWEELRMGEVHGLEKILKIQERRFGKFLGFINRDEPVAGPGLQRLRRTIFLLGFAPAVRNLELALFRAGLLQYGDCGVLLTGKHTGGRVRRPWKHWSFDTVLVSYRNSTFYAQELPSWVEGLESPDAPRWNSFRTVPLRMVANLSAGKNDCAVPMAKETSGTTLAAAELQALHSSSSPWRNDLPVPRFVSVFNFARTMAARLPAFELECTPAGRPWEQLPLPQAI